MASRPTRNHSKTLQSTPSPTPTSPKGKARKSFTSSGAKTRQSAQVSALSSTTTSSQSTSQGRTSSKNGGGPPTKKPTRKISNASSDLSVSTQNTARLMRGKSSSDSEDAESSSKQKQTRKRTLRNNSSSEDSDTNYVPPTRDTAKSKKSISTPSVSTTSGASRLNDSGRAKLNSSQAFGVKGSPSKQTGYLKNLINKCVFYILVADQKKHAIRKADILKSVFEDQNAKENYSLVLIEANKILKKSFGLEMLALQNQKNSYIIINILDPDHGIREFAEYSEVELQKRGLIFLLLTIIFMNENAIAEDKLWKALGPLGISPNSSVPHLVFGNVKKYITTELVKEMYLEYTRVNKDPVQYEFTWGERAYQEVKKKDLLEFACNIMGDSKPEDWKLQFLDAKPKTANNTEA